MVAVELVESVKYGGVGAHIPPFLIQIFMMGLPTRAHGAVEVVLALLPRVWGLVISLFVGRAFNAATLT